MSQTPVAEKKGKSAATRRWRILNAILGGALVLALITGVGVRFGVRIPQVLGFIEHRVDGLKVGRFGRLHVSGARGDLWRDLSVKRVALSDDKGVWAEAHDVRLVWRPADLLQRRFHAERLTGRDLRILRRPILGPSSRSRGLPVSIRIDSLKTRLSLEPAFSYRRGLYDLTAELNIRRRNRGQKGAIEAVSLLHRGDRLDASFDVGRRRPLSVTIKAKEASGGAIAGALGLATDRAFLLSISANGKTSEGRFSAVATTGAETPLDASGAWGPGGGQAEGRLSLAASSLTQGLAARLGPGVTFKGFGRKTPGGLYALEGQAKADNLAVLVRGQGDIGERRTGPAGMFVELTTPDLSKPTNVTGLGPTRVVGVLRGDGKALQFKGRADMTGFARQGYLLSRISGPVELNRRKGEYMLKADLAGAGGQGSGLLLAALGPSPHLQLEGARLSDRRLLLRDLTVEGAGLEIDASGGRTLLGGLTFKGKAQLSNLKAWRADAAGSVTADWWAEQGGAGRPWMFKADARGETFASGLAELDRLLGEQPTLAAKAEWGEGALQVAEARLAGAALKADASGVLSAERGLDFRLNWSATGPFRAGPVEITGKADGQGELSGELGSPVIKLQADVDGIDVPRLPLKNAHVTLTFARQADGSSGDAALRADSPFGRARAQTAFRFPEGGVDLTDLDVDAGGVKAAGSLSLRRRTPSSADLQVTLTRGAFLDEGRIDGRVRILDAPGGPRGDVDLTAKDAIFKSARFAVAEAQVSAAGPLARLPYSVQAQGVSAAGRWRLAGSGDLASREAGYDLAFNGEGRVGRRDLRTTETAHFGLEGANRTARLRLTTGDGGEIDLDAQIERASAEIDARVAKVDLGLFNEDLAGQINGYLALKGSGGPLAGSLNARLSGARGRGADPATGVDGAVTAHLAGSTLSLHAESANRQGLQARADVVLPAVSTTAPFRVAIDRTRPISGEFFADGELRPLWDLIMDSDRSLSGHVHTEGKIGGTLADPKILGEGTLASGRFEDGATGLVLKNLQLAARFANEAIDVTQAVGADSHGGSVSGGGRINLARNGDSSFRLDLKGFRVIDNDQASATATGQVTIDRKADGKIRMAGDLAVNQAEIAADPPTPSGVVRIDVVERNKPVDVGTSLAAPRKSGPGMALDVKLKAPRRIYLRGRGLDMEFSLDAHVGGTTSRPVLDGVARVVRGDYDFAGKRFEFDSRGVVYLASSAQAIRLDLTAIRSDTSLIAVVKVSGTAAKPVITLTSSPVLPNDEVLSQVLFGVSASQLSPLEAAQLASALSALAGGGGFDVIGGLRTFAGLDRLALAGGGQSALSVSGGKYLTDDVYLELTGGGKDGASAQVEWRVRPTLSIISRIAGQGDGRLAVRWRKDY